MDSIKCFRCERGYIFKSNSTCIECATSISQQEFDQVLEQVNIQNGMDLYKAGMFDSALIELLKIASIGNQVLHPHHHILLNVYVNLISLHSRVNKFQGAEEYCVKAIEQMKWIAGDAKMGLYNMELANLYEKHGELLEILAEATKAGILDVSRSVESLLEQSKEQYSMASEIHKVLYGTNILH
jgi:tetratricopeptide (TPR) repeat protein